MQTVKKKPLRLGTAKKALHKRSIKGSLNESVFFSFLSLETKENKNSSPDSRNLKIYGRIFHPDLPPRCFAPRPRSLSYAQR